MRPFEKKLLKCSAYALILFIVAAILMPFSACGCSKISAPRSICLRNLKHQGLAFLLYHQDFDDRYPDRDQWMDSIAPYVKDQSFFHEAKTTEGVFGYAFNAALSGVKILEPNEKMPLVYDSTNSAKNASDHLTSLPEPGKHVGRNNVAYADGHAKSLAKGAKP